MKAYTSSSPYNYVPTLGNERWENELVDKENKPFLAAQTSSLETSDIQPIRVIILDDQVLFGNCLGKALSDFKEIQMVQVFGSGPAFLEYIQTHDQSTDIVIMDYWLSETNASELLDIMKEKRIKTNVLVLTQDMSPLSIRNVLNRGAKGFLTKNEQTSIYDVVNAIRRIVLSREKYLSEQVLEILTDKMTDKQLVVKNKIALLTNQELVILQLVAKGLESAEIGDKLFIAKNTVDTHRRRIMAKIQAKNAVELANFAFKNGLG